MQFEPTPDQQQVITDEEQAAFVSACPGAGKTRIMVERARRVLRRLPLGRGMAFLSFTNSAISELEARLRGEDLLDDPSYPNFVGTFDRFVWAFLVAPFGFPDGRGKPRLVPDIENRTVVPFRNAQPLPLRCFAKETGEMIPKNAKLEGFPFESKKSHQIRAYCPAASRLRQKILEKGQLDFDDARALALRRVRDDAFGRRLGKALAGRFDEIIVDEAQDCNPDDLEIIGWLKRQNICVKVICDPFQSIYEFRGGVTDDLFDFRDTFHAKTIKTLRGNFRSSDNICKTVSALRPSSEAAAIDEALGPNRDVAHPIHILSYSGKGASAKIGSLFAEKVAEAGEDLSRCPLVAPTHQTGAGAVGRKASAGSNKLLRLADCVSRFDQPESFRDMRKALVDLHEIVVDFEGKLGGGSYGQFIVEYDMGEFDWRPQILDLMQRLRFDPEKDVDARAWHERIKEVLSSRLSVKGSSIGQKLKWDSGVEQIHPTKHSEKPMHRSIHSVKGLEFPGVCVVLSTKKAGGILDFIEHGEPAEKAEDARKLYVGASRAERLLVLAVPRNQGPRLRDRIEANGGKVQFAEI